MRRIATERPATEVVVVRVIMLLGSLFSLWLAGLACAKFMRSSRQRGRDPLTDGSVSGAGAVLLISWPGASGER